MTTVAHVVRAEQLRAAVDRAVEEYGPLKPFAAQLRALTNIEVQAARRGVPSTPAPVPAAPVITEQRRVNAFTDFFEGDAVALAEDLRGSPRVHPLVDFFGRSCSSRGSGERRDSAQIARRCWHSGPRRPFRAHDLACEGIAGVM